MVDGEDRAEFRPETPESLARKTKILCKWMSEARHVVFFTGPEISEPAGAAEPVGVVGVGVVATRLESNAEDSIAAGFFSSSSSSISSSPTAAAIK